MKLHISINKAPLNGYTNISPMGGEEKFICNPKNLEGLVEDAQCTEIIAEDILDYIASNDILNFLTYYVKKLRHKGKLIIGGTDLYSLCKAVVTKNLNVLLTNHLLHGEQTHPWDFKYGQISLDDLVDLLKSLGLKILKKRVNGYKMVVEAERP